MRATGQATGQIARQVTGALALQLPDQGFPSERRRVETVVETLATLRSDGESLAELAHDARNMVTALGLYCDLLEEPGVLATQFAHYGNELRLVAAASRRLVEKLVALDVRGTGVSASQLPGSGQRSARGTRTPAALEASPSRNTAPRAIGMLDDADRLTLPAVSGRFDLIPPALISNLAQDLLASRNLLSALAGPSIALSVDVEGGALPVRMSTEDLTRVLVNLVKNAVEAMPEGGTIRIGLHKQSGPSEDLLKTKPQTGLETAFEADSETASGTVAEANRDGRIMSPWLSLTIEDNGPGIPPEALGRIFEAGFTTRATQGAASGGWPSVHRGLGLSITRSIVEAAGGRTSAANREGPGTPNRGARIEILLPVRSR